MIEKKEIISGTEEELLEYFKKKYNLVKYEYVGDCEQEQPEQETPKQHVDELSNATQRREYPRTGVSTQKQSTGFSGLFDGTSWGKK
jgi:hypothetical protein